MCILLVVNAGKRTLVAVKDFATNSVSEEACQIIRIFKPKIIPCHL